MKDFVFFLGRRDLEMDSIKQHVKGFGFYDTNLKWGAKASDYKTVIEFAHSDKRTPVLLELEVDFDLPANAIIDNHNDRSGEKASILQVLELIGQEPSRDDLLVAANDSGYILAMLAMGATQVEIDDIRLRDCKSRGVTDEMEQQAVKAIEEATEGLNGLKVVLLPHTKCSPVTDRLFTSWPDGKENLLVMSVGDDAQVGEFNYFGRGDICKAFKEQFAPDSWGGGKGYGNFDGSGFAGCRNATAYAVKEFFNNLK